MDIGKIINYLEEFSTQINAKREPGFCSAIVHNGEVVHKLNHGLASMEHDKPLTSDSLFYLASVSKQFTAACILKLVHDKKLKLTQDVRDIVKETEQLPEKITIQNLLNHTSGIPDYMIFIFCQLDLGLSDYFDNTHILKILSRIEDLNFKPNEQHSYSNSNYIILAEVVKQCTGKPISKYAKENLFKPVGMKHTIFDDDRLKVIKNRVSGYTSEPGCSQKFRADLKNSCTVGDGGVLSSTNDLLKWEINMHKNLDLDGPVVNGLKKFRKLNSGELIPYANGLGVSPPEAKVPYFDHGGGFDGFNTYFLRVPSEKMSLIVLSNNCHVNIDRSRIFEALG